MLQLSEAPQPKGQIPRLLGQVVPGTEGVLLRRRGDKKAGAFFSLLTVSGKDRIGSHIPAGVFVPCFDGGTESCFSFHKQENVKYITNKINLAHKLVHYVNSGSQNSVSLSVSIRCLGL